MAIVVIRSDGKRVDVTDRPEVLDLIRHINQDSEELDDMFSLSEPDEVVEDEESYTLRVGDHIIRESVEFNLRGHGWRVVKTTMNADGTTDIVLGR